MHIYVETCQNGTDSNIVCKSPEQIEEFLRDKYILLVYNEIVFNTTGYGDERISKRSKLEWIKLGTQNKRVAPYEMINAYTDVQEGWIDLNKLTE